MQTKVVGKIVAKAAGLGDRQIRAIASSETPDRAGDVMKMAGCDLSEWKRNPIVLAGHDPQSPIGTGTAIISGFSLIATITFAPLGASPKADEWCELAKAGIISALSIGFVPKERTPISGGGWRYDSFEILEISLVSVPCNPDALVIERDYRRSSRMRTSEERAAEIGRLRELGRMRDLHQLETIRAANSFAAASGGYGGARRMTTRAERDAEIFALRFGGRKSQEQHLASLSGSPAHHVVAIRAKLESEVLAMSSRLYRETSTQAQRAREIESLRRA